MTDTPKDGDLGLTRHPLFVRYNGSEWMHPNGRDADVVTPTGERAVPIEWHDDVKALAREMRGMAQRNRWADSLDLMDWADILDPPTQEPEPRWPENTIVVYGDNEYLYIVNADGVPCSLRGVRTGFPLDSDRWRVVGTFTPTEGGEGHNRLQDAAEIVGRAVAAKHRLEADWKAATAVADGDGQ